MDNYKSKLVLNQERNPWVSFFSLSFLVLAGLLLGQYLGAIIIVPIFDMDFQEISFILNEPTEHPEARIPLMIVQAFGATFAFILAPLYHIYIFHKKKLKNFFNKKSEGIIPIILTVFITVSFMVVNSVIIEWNENIQLPDALAPFEEWAREAEERAQKLTGFLTNFESFRQYLLGMVVIAIIPAIGEELLFRGLIQNIFHRITGSIHVAIIIAGFIFSVIHFQFFGLLPRMFLGIIFGYLYAWSGSLLIPIVAHFVNNGLTITLIYLHRINIIKYDIEADEVAPWPNIFMFLLIGITLIYYFRKYLSEKGINNE